MDETDHTWYIGHAYSTVQMQGITNPRLRLCGLRSRVIAFVSACKRVRL